MHIITPFLYLLTFLSGLLFVKLFMKIALAFNIVDKPDNLIKMHKKVTPYLGGVAFFTNALLFFVIYLLINGFSLEKKEIFILTGGLVMLFIGIYDDIKRIKPQTKFLLQSIVAVSIILSGIYVDIAIFPHWLNIIITFFWIVGISNAFNLIDIMDGLCGGVAAISAFFLFFANLPHHHFLIFLTVSIISFLVYNLPPAKIFMGDAGSLTIGFLLSVYSIYGSFTTNNKTAFITPLLILWLPIYETILVSVMRIKKGKSPFKGSKDHFALRLRSIGFPVPAILIISYFFSIIMGESAFLATYLDSSKAFLIYSLLFLFFLLFFFLLSKIRVDE